MVVPSFTGFAPTPHVAASFLGGVAASQRDTEEVNRVAIAGQQINLAREKLQQEAVQSQMELQAKQQVLQQQSMRADQELKIKQQYDQQMIGMKQQQVDQAAKMIAFKTQEVARKFQAQQQYQARVSGGEDASKVMQELGPGMGMTGAGMARMLQSQSDGPQIPGSMQEAEGGGKVFWNTGKHAQYIPPPSELGTQRLEMQKENFKAKTIADQIKGLEREDAGDTLANIAEGKQARDTELKQRDKEALEGRKARRSKIADLRKSLSGNSKPSGKFKEGQVLTHKKTGEKYRVTNGVPVPMDSPPPVDDDTEEE